MTLLILFVLLSEFLDSPVFPDHVLSDFTDCATLSPIITDFFAFDWNSNIILCCQSQSSVVDCHFPLLSRIIFHNESNREMNLLSGWNLTYRFQIANCKLINILQFTFGNISNTFGKMAWKCYRTRIIHVTRCQVNVKANGIPNNDGIWKVNLHSMHWIRDTNLIVLISEH